MDHWSEQINTPHGEHQLLFEKTTDATTSSIFGCSCGESFWKLESWEKHNSFKLIAGGPQHSYGTPSTTWNNFPVESVPSSIIASYYSGSEADSTEADQNHGTCGSGITWTLDENGVLEIKGSGAMTSFKRNDGSVFYPNHRSIKKIIIHQGITEIGDYAFSFCMNLTEVQIPGSVKRIGKDAFAACYSLKNVTIPTGVTRIGDYAFYECTGISSVSIPSSVNTIESYAFSKDTNLTKIVIPGSVKQIGIHAFAECSGLTTLTVRGDLPQGKDSVFNHWFNMDIVSDCNKLTTVTLTGNEVQYLCLNQLIERGYDDIGPMGHIQKIVISDTVKRIDQAGLMKLTSLTSIEIPKSVTYIGDCAFQETTKLTDIYYEGNAAQWKKICKDTTLSSNVKIHCAEKTALSTPKLKKVANTKNSVTVSWNEVTGAAKYRVLYKFSGGTWKKAADTTNTSLSVAKLTSGKNYTFTVRCLDALGNSCSKYDTKGLSIKYLATPSVKAVKATKGIKVTWNKIGGAKGYYVYRKNGSKWVKIATISSGSTIKYIDKKTKKGKTYTYSIRAFYGNTQSYYNTKGVSAKAG